MGVWGELYPSFFLIFFNFFNFAKPLRFVGTKWRKVCLCRSRHMCPGCGDDDAPSIINFAKSLFVGANDSLAYLRTARRSDSCRVICAGLATYEVARTVANVRSAKTD